MVMALAFALMSVSDGYDHIPVNGFSSTFLLTNANEVMGYAKGPPADISVWRNGSIRPLSVKKTLYRYKDGWSSTKPVDYRGYFLPAWADTSNLVIGDCEPNDRFVHVLYGSVLLVIDVRAFEYDWQARSVAGDRSGHVYVLARPEGGGTGKFLVLDTRTLRIRVYETGQFVGAMDVTLDGQVYATEYERGLVTWAAGSDLSRPGKQLLSAEDSEYWGYPLHALPNGDVFFEHTKKSFVRGRMVDNSTLCPGNVKDEQQTYIVGQDSSVVFWGPEGEYFVKNGHLIDVDFGNRGFRSVNAIGSILAEPGRSMGMWVEDSDSVLLIPKKK